MSSKTAGESVKLFYCFLSPGFPLNEDAFGTDSPAFVIYYTSALFMMDETF